MGRTTGTTAILLATVVTLAGSAWQGAGQSGSDRMPILLGVQPMVTIEPHYGQGEFDINMIPVVLGFELTPSMDLKIAPIETWQFGGDHGLRQLGVEVSTPYYFLPGRKEGGGEGPFGAPLVSYTRNFIDDGNELTVGLEVGYTILFKGGTELKIGLQEGATFFFGNPDTEKTVNHFGIKVSFGWWFSRRATEAP